MLIVKSRDVPVMLQVYEENNYPSDRLVRNQCALGGFVKEFNRRVGRAYSKDDVADSLMHIRKDRKGTGGLPHLGRDYNGPNFLN